MTDEKAELEELRALQKESHKLREKRETPAQKAEAKPWNDLYTALKFSGAQNGYREKMIYA